MDQKVAGFGFRERCLTCWGRRGSFERNFAKPATGFAIRKRRHKLTVTNTASRTARYERPSRTTVTNRPVSTARDEPPVTNRTLRTTVTNCPFRNTSVANRERVLPGVRGSLHCSSRHDAGSLHVTSCAPTHASRSANTRARKGRRHPGARRPVERAVQGVWEGERGSNTHPPT